MGSRAIYAIALASGLIFTALEGVTSGAFDFRAFYCAGFAVNLHANPYHSEPLHACERDRTDGYYRAFSRTTVLPAPLPGYDIAAFRPLARLPFVPAKVLWATLLMAAIGVTIAALARIGGVSALAAFAALWLSLVLPSLQYGEIIPIAVAGIAVAAYCARVGRWDAAAVAGAVSLCEPHIGLPVCLALFVWARQTRFVLACSVALLAAISLATLGPGVNAEYFRAVLPLHALSEIGSDAQLSISAILHYAGVSGMTAVRAGTLWYAIMALVALPIARSLAVRTKENAFLVAVPAALALVGGSFIHVTDMAAAFPLAFLIYDRLASYRAWVVCGIVLLALPWWHLALLLHQQMYGIVPMTGAVALYLTWDLLGRKLPVALAYSACVTIALVGVNHWYVQTSDAYHRAPRTIAVPISSVYPEASWAWTNARFISTGLPASWALRIPSWAGLLLVIGSGVFALRPSSEPIERRASERTASV